MKELKKLIYILITVITLGVSCIKDVPQNCLYPCVFSFHFIEKEADKTKSDFSEKISNVSLFVYDLEGVLIGRYDELRENLKNGNEITILLAPGNYNVVTWGGVEKSYAYKKTEGYDAAELSVLRNDKNELLEQPEHFFFAADNMINVKAETTGEEVEVHHMDFKRNSHNVEIDVTVSSEAITEVDLSTIVCYVTAFNGDYKFDNKTFGSDQITYIPITKLLTDTCRNNFVVLKLWEGDGSIITVLRNYVVDGVEKVDSIYSESLSKMISEDPDIDFENFDDIEIIITLGPEYIVTQITINNWRYIDVEEPLMPTIKKLKKKNKNRKDI